MAYVSKIPMSLVLEKLKMSSENKSSFNIPCPLCLKEKPKNKILHIDMEKNAFRCPKCESSGSSLHFFGFIKYGYTKNYIDDNKEVKNEILAEIFEGKTTNLQNFEYKQQEIKRIDVDPTFLKDRNVTYNALINHSELSNEHYNNLVKRGLRELDIFENRYASTPKIGFTKIPSELRKEACDLLGVAGFYKKNNVWTLYKTNSGFYIPVRDISDNFNNRLGPIQGMQIRYDTLTSKDDVRYKWLSTKDMDSGCAAETYSHFVGFPEQTVILTEGILKADIIFRFMDVPVIGIPGVSSIQNLRPMLEKLWALGVRKIKTAFDMDYKKNINIQDAYVNLLLCLQEFGFIVERMLWDENEKGLDDYLLKVFLEKGGKLDTLK